MNDAVRKAGLASTRQIKTGDWSEVRGFLAALQVPPPTDRSNPNEGPVPEEFSENVPAGTNGPTRATGHEGKKEARGETPPLDDVMSIVKPARGCASGSVFLCKGESEAKEAFEKILGTPKYGTPGAVNDEVPHLECSLHFLVP